MRRHGKTKAGRERYFCPRCKKATTIRRDDTRIRHKKDRLVAWLTSPDSKTEIAKRYGLTRQTLWKEFRPFFKGNADGSAPLGYEADILIVDAKFIHGSELCALIAVDEHDKIFWQFADGENYGTWYAALIRFKPPKVVVADGEKGVAVFLKRHWPDTKFQRCHFHIVKLVIQYLSRNPREEAGVEILKLMYRLKWVKTHQHKERWLMFHKIWEKRFEKAFSEKDERGRYTHKKLRSVRVIVRRALPDLFTYLDFPGCPNTTNLVEGWVNAALAEALRRHRGLHLSQKKILVSIILSHLTREKPA
jgi:Transposase, Mutator family